MLRMTRGLPPRWVLRTARFDIGLAGFAGNQLRDFGFLPVQQAREFLQDADALANSERSPTGLRRVSSSQGGSYFKFRSALEFAENRAGGRVDGDNLAGGYEEVGGHGWLKLTRAGAPAPHGPPRATRTAPRHMGRTARDG